MKVNSLIKIICLYYKFIQITAANLYKIRENKLI